MPTVLVVEDEAPIQQLIRFNLERAGFQVMVADEGSRALCLAKEVRPDIIIVDLMLPGLDGLTLLRELKRGPETAPIPVMILSAKSEEVDKVMGLEMGADDYITKPFSLRELVARVKACLRRPYKEVLEERTREVIEVGPFVLDLRERRFYVDNQSVEVTPKEFKLMQCFLLNVGRLVRRDTLLREIWGYEWTDDTRVLDVYVHHLRQKISIIPSEVARIETVRQVGYRFCLDLP